MGRMAKQQLSGISRTSMKTLLGLLLCLVSQTSRVGGQGTDLGGGVVTRTDVEYLADLTLDVRDIEQSMATGGTDTALRIYLEGKNSEKQVGVLYKLGGLSTEMASSSSLTPSYLFHLYGLSGRSTTDVAELLADGTYADVFVRDSIQNRLQTSSKAALVLNMWMFATHKLYQGVDTCQKKSEADNPSQFDLAGGGLDEFIALWIGTGQTHASSEGFGLYALAEQADKLFAPREDDSGGATVITTNTSLAESSVNQQIKLLYQEGASIFSLPDACTSSNKDTPKKLWSVVSRIIKQMHIPLLRMLIVSILEQDTAATELYATAIVPQAIQCRPSTYNRLREELLTGDPNFQRTEFILKDLHDIYACLGVSCDDIGEVIKGYDNVRVPSCLAAVDNAPMALYKPSTDVHPIARIDLDIFQIRELTTLGSFNYAKLWYMYGRNSPRQRDSEYDPYDYYSLSELAVSTSRRNAEPFYSAFVSYHNDPNYADKLIRHTLNGVGKWDGTKSVAQRSAVITEACSFHVVYLHLIAQINAALNECRNVEGEEDPYQLTHPWDEVAALAIGSMEGMDEGGSSDVHDGQLIWGLSTRQAFQFQTLNSQGYAKANSELEDLLFAGKGELDALECDMLKKTADSIIAITLIPLMQSVVKYAIQNEQIGPDSASADLALGEVFAMAIIPIVEMYDPASAAILEENMIVQPDIQPVRDGAQTVANAMGSTAAAAGLRPQQLGSTPQADPSALYGGASSCGCRSLAFTIIATFIAFAFVI